MSSRGGRGRGRGKKRDGSGGWEQWVKLKEN